jgi:hypothetical protein
VTTASPVRTALVAPEESVVANAYVYLMGRALVIRQEHTDLKRAGAAYNEIRYNPLGSADFVNPNLDVAYLEAWFAVDPFTPVMLWVPEIHDRYYTAQILDEWGEVIANINERSFPSRPYGAFVLVHPGSYAGIPFGTRRIELHSAKAKLLARVELRDDADGALRLQRGFRATSLGKPEIDRPAEIPDFDNNTLMGAEIFDHVGAILMGAMDVSPAAARMQQQVWAVSDYANSGAAARKTLDRLIHDKVVGDFKDYAFRKSAPYRDHWVGGAPTGNYGADYWLRTTVNYAGIWANTTDEVIYFVATRDADEQPLSGGNAYVMHFPVGKLPASAVYAYWSVILVGVPDYRVMPNALKRYNLNSQSRLQYEADGSLKIAIGPSLPPGIAQSNWLPSAEGRAFSLTFRTYVPRDMVRRGDWSPPAVTRIPATQPRRDGQLSRTFV